MIVFCRYNIHACISSLDFSWCKSSHEERRWNNILPGQCSVNPRCCAVHCPAGMGSRSAVDGDGEGHKMGSGRLSDVARRGWVWPGCGAWHCTLCRDVGGRWGLLGEEETVLGTNISDNNGPILNHNTDTSDLGGGRADTLVTTGLLSRLCPGLWSAFSWNYNPTEEWLKWIESLEHWNNTLWIV